MAHLYAQRSGLDAPGFWYTEAGGGTTQEPQNGDVLDLGNYRVMAGQHFVGAEGSEFTLVGDGAGSGRLLFSDRENHSTIHVQQWAMVEFGKGSENCGDLTCEFGDLRLGNIVFSGGHNLGSIVSRNGGIVSFSDGYNYGRVVIRDRGNGYFYVPSRNDGLIICESGRLWFCGGINGRALVCKDGKTVFMREGRNEGIVICEGGTIDFDHDTTSTGALICESGGRILYNGLPCSGFVYSQCGGEVRIEGSSVFNGQALCESGGILTMDAYYSNWVLAYNGARLSDTIAVRTGEEKRTIHYRGDVEAALDRLLKAIHFTPPSVEEENQEEDED